MRIHSHQLGLMAIISVFVTVSACTMGETRDSDYGKPSSTTSPQVRSGSGSGSVSDSDRDFVAKAAQTGLLEVESGRLALQKASDPAVKRFANNLVTAHSQANDQLKSIASDQNIDVPGDMAPEHRDMINQLQQLSGRDFDREFLSAQLQAHQNAIDVFRSQADNGQSDDLVNYARNMLPALESHMQEAMQTAELAGFEVVPGDATQR